MEKYLHLSKKIKKNTVWISESLLSNEIIDAKYVRKFETFRKIIKINEFQLSKTGKTGNGLYTVYGVQNKKILFESKGLMDINFVNGAVGMYENIQAPWDQNINMMEKNESTKISPVKDEIVSGYLMKNGGIIEKYAQKLPNGDISSLIGEYRLFKG